MKSCLESLPQELHEAPHWVCWRYEERNGQEPTKPLINPRTGKYANVSIPGTWSDRETAVAAVQKFHCDGVGIVLTEDSELTGIDIDDCLDPKTGLIDAVAESIVKTLDSYAEVTPSGTGLRVWVRGKLTSEGNSRNLGRIKVEIYSRKRYFTVTGNHLAGTRTTVESRQAELDEVHSGIFGTSSLPQPAPPPTTEDSALLRVRKETDEDLLRRARSNPKFARLWDGSAEDYNGDESSADEGLCCLLAYWTAKDSERIERLFSQSKLGARDKWRKRSDYRKRTVQAAVKFTKEVWTPRPSVEIKPNELTRITDEVEAELLVNATRLGIFQRGGEVTTVIRLPKERRKPGIKYPVGTLMLEPLCQARAIETFDTLISFVKYSERKKRLVSTDCPAKIVATYFGRKGFWKLPVLLGTVAAPLMREDGTILDSPGFDEATQLYFDSECEWLRVPDAPSREDARAALEILKAPFAEFPFVAEEDRAVVIVGILTGLQRRVLSACPIIGMSAPAPRSGKSLLAEAMAIVALGKPAPASTCSTDKEEFRKNLTSILRQGQLIVNLDNLEQPLKSAELCMILTQEEYGDRLLGENTQLHLPTNMMWTATGNNLIFRGDLATRALLCRIDPKEESPEERTFRIKDLKAHLLERRAELVAAALTILKAFHVAKNPVLEPPVKPWGGFDEWSASIREPLVWAGAADPCKTRERILGDDPEKEAASVALRELSGFFDGKEFSAGEAVSAACEKLSKTYCNPQLHEALKTVTGGKAEIDSWRFGAWLKHFRGRFVNGMTLERANTESTHPATWKVTR